MLTTQPCRNQFVEMAQVTYKKYVDEFNEKSTADGFQINESKCKEIRISFAPSTREFQPITINGKNVELVTSVKLLGLTISDNLKWNSHISYICKKVAPRLYFLRQLKRAKLPANDQYNPFLLHLYSASHRVCVPSISRLTTQISVRRT